MSKVQEGVVPLYRMSVEANLMNFEAIFSCENKLILQALAVFQKFTTANLNPHHQIFRPLGGFHLIRRCYETKVSASIH